MTRERLKIGAYNVIMPRILGLSFHTIYLTYRLLAITFRGLKNLKGKKLLYYPIILYYYALNETCEELISYNHGYIAKARAQRIYFIHGIMFFNMKPQNLFMMAHNSAGHFKSSTSLLSVKSKNLKNPMKKEGNHATIPIDENGDKIATMGMMTTDPRPISKNLYRGDKSHISINQIQEVSDLNNTNVTRVRMSEDEVKKQMLQIKLERAKNENLGIYENNTQ
jgi:hypothetical protein